MRVLSVKRSNVSIRFPHRRNTPFFTEGERAALLWTEQVAVISKDHVSNEVYDEVSRHLRKRNW